MKKLILILAVGLLLVSCGTNVVTDGEVASGEMKFTILNINGCQYLYHAMGYQEGYMFSHMGNCNNPIHICNCKTDTIK